MSNNLSPKRGKFRKITVFSDTVFWVHTEKNKPLGKNKVSDFVLFGETFTEYHSIFISGQ